MVCPDKGCISKREAVLGQGKSYDCLRHSFFARARTEDEACRQEIIPLLFDVRDRVENLESQKVLQEFARVLIDSPHASTATARLPYPILLRAFGHAILRDNYWLSQLELTCLAEIAGQNLLVAEILESRLSYACHVEIDATAGLGSVALQSNRHASVGSNCSRLVAKS